MELRWGSVWSWNKKYTVSLFSASNPQSVDQHRFWQLSPQWSITYSGTTKWQEAGSVQSQAAVECLVNVVYFWLPRARWALQCHISGLPIRVPDFFSLAVTLTQITKQTHNELGITLLSITQQRLTQWPTSMGRLPDVPNENPAIIWRAGKNVVIHWAHRQAIHCIFMSKHIQGLTAEKQNREAIGTNIYTDKVQSPSPTVPS